MSKPFLKKLVSPLFVIFLGALFGTTLIQARTDDAVMVGENPSETTTEITEPTAPPEPVPVEVFERAECKNCQAEKKFLTSLAEKRSDFTIRYHDLADPEHYGHWNQLTELENIPKVTPITLVGNVVIQGFDAPETTGQRIEELIELSVGQHTLNFEEFIAAGGSGQVETYAGTCDDGNVCTIETEPMLIKVPFLGVINLKDYSLPSLSVVLGLIDGFNPCALWVLVIFLTFLVQAGSKKRMWIMAGLFVFAEAIMYYLILNVWFTAWDFVGLDNIITPIVGIVAIGGGGFFLWEGIKSDGTCKITNSEQKARTSQKIQKLVNSPLTILGILGIIGIAFSVNIIEFACSIGIPQAYTKILDINGLDFVTRQGYMLIYILFYMFDDFLIFGLALYSFEKIGLTHKYAKWSHLFGGILMLILGLILLIKPSLLVF